MVPHRSVLEQAFMLGERHNSAPTPTYSLTTWRFTEWLLCDTLSITPCTTRGYNPEISLRPGSALTSPHLKLCLWSVEPGHGQGSPAPVHLGQCPEQAGISGEQRCGHGRG